jgi:hypothetical protein
VAVQELSDTGDYQELYNLRVAQYHTYFVGEEEWRFSVWAHNTSCDSFALGQELENAGFARGPGEQAAHVVPTGDFSGRSQSVQEAIQTARLALESEGIGLNSVGNGFFAPVGHYGTHSDEYFLALGNVMGNAIQNGTVKQTLSAIVRAFR